MVRADLKTAGFNVREALVQLVLLERHLAHPDERCPDCIQKHALMFEGLLKEASNLDGAERWKATIAPLLRFSAQLNEGIRAGKDPKKLAAAVRVRRKALQAVAF